MGDEGTNIFFDVNDLRLAAHTEGSPSGQLVLLLHGGGQTRHAWAPTAKRLAAEGYYTITVDLRGHGESAWAPGGEYELEHFASDLSEIGAQMGRPATFIGASLGGVSSLVAIAEAPDQRALANGLILVDVAPKLELGGVKRILEFMSARPEGYESLEEVVEAIAKYNPHRTPRTNYEGLRHNLRRQSDSRWTWHWDPAFLVEDQEVPRVTRVARRVELAARRLVVPTLVIRGGDSDTLSEDGISHLRELVPGLEVATVPNAGHMVVGDQNDAFNEAILAYLTTLLDR